MAKMRMSKEEYDKLYFYTSQTGFDRISKGASPLDFTSPRRYGTIDECRKAAVAKAKKNLDEIRHVGYSMQGGAPVYVFKGTRYLGCAEYDEYRPKGAAHVGLWYSADSPRDPSPIYQDGSIQSKGSIPAPKKAPSKPKTAPKTPKGKNPGTLVAVVDGKFAPVNGFSYPKTLVKTFAKNMESIYARMYDGEIDEDPWVDKGDRLLETNRRLVAALAVERQDLLTSDREIAAFAYALAHSKDRSKLLAIDKPSAPAKKPAAKRVQSTFDRGWRSWHPR